MLAHVIQAMLLSAVVAGCSQPGNPSFAVSEREARAALKEMHRQRRPQARPIVILGGYTDPGVGTTALATQLRGVFEEPVGMVTVSYPLNLSFDACRRDVIAAVEKRWPSGDPRETVEVDVVAMSMGGLVARYCAVDPPAETEGLKRLKVRRLFTVSSPHQGAKAAALPALMPLHRDMRQGSGFRSALVSAEKGAGIAGAAAEEKAGGETPARAEMEIVAYVRLGDGIVGPENAGPPGGGPAWWVPNPPFQSAHVGAAMDARIAADIARRLRGEQPFTREPAGALPGG